MPIYDMGFGPLQFSPKRPLEILTLGFDFRPVLATGETILSGSWYIQAVKPTTASVAGMLVGAVTIVSGQSFQRVGGGDDEAVYVLVAQIITSNSNVIEENALLRISDSPHI